MKRQIKTLGTIAIMVIMIVCAYLLGTTQAKTVTEVQTVTEVREVEKIVEVIPDGYVDMTVYDFYNNYVDMRQVTDFAVDGNSLELYMSDGSGYYWEQ